MNSCKTLIGNRSTKGIDGKSQGYFTHRVSHVKLEAAVKRTIEDEIPFLETYTEEQKAIYNKERMLRTKDPKETSKDCCFGTGKFGHTPDVPVKNMTLKKAIKRTIFDEIPYLFNDFVKPKNCKRLRR